MSGMHDYCISPGCDGKFRRAYYTKVNGSMTKCRSCWESEKRGHRQTRTDVPNPRSSPKEDDVETDDNGKETSNLDDLLLQLAKRAEEEEEREPDDEPDYVESEDGSGEEDDLREGEGGSDKEDGMAEDAKTQDDPKEDDWYANTHDEQEESGEDDDVSDVDNKSEVEGEEDAKTNESDAEDEDDGEPGSSDADESGDPPPEMPKDIEDQIDNLVQLCDGRYVRMTNYQEDNNNLNIRFEAIEEKSNLDKQTLKRMKENQESLKTDIVQQVEEITATIRPVQVTIQGGSREPGIVSGIRHKMFDPVL